MRFARWFGSDWPALGLERIGMRRVDSLSWLGLGLGLGGTMDREEPV